MAESQETSGSRPGTPPHHPTFGVSLPQEYIQDTIAILYPNGKLRSIEQLPTGKSFNNRIYFVSVDASSHPVPGPRADVQNLVLKVNGRFFGAHKIQNEVACLGILERYCPELPVPRVVAWSEDGSIIQTKMASEGGPPVHAQPDLSSARGRHPGWILMTRLPGEPFSSVIDTVRDGEAVQASVGQQLAEIVASWRTKVPPARHCGNILIVPRDGKKDAKTEAGESTELDDVPELTGSVPRKLAIRGLLGDGIPPSQTPISSVLDLHRVRFRAKLRELETVDTYAPNRGALVPLVSHFIAETLPHLFAGGGAGVGMGGGSVPAPAEFVFTHYDLSPRNTLVSFFPDPTASTTSHASPKITGIIDFEFAGFFPPSHEFVNDYVDNGGDWPEQVYSSYLARLAELGVPTPRRGIDERLWKLEHRLGILLDSIAPWWLPGGMDGDAVEAKLLECRGVAEGCVRELGAA